MSKYVERNVVSVGKGDDRIEFIRPVSVWEALRVVKKKR